MIVIAWNCRGVGNRETIRHAKLLLTKKDVGAICFLETKTNKADNLLKAMSNSGFDNFFSVNTLGFAGGLLLVWNKNRLDLEVVRSNSQVIHCNVKGTGVSHLHLSFAYVRPNPQAKELFWNECKSFGSAIVGPWIMLGDFKDIASPNDHWGNDHVNMNNVTRFCKAYEDCGLMEVSSTGPKFTWLRQIGGRTVTRRKLDRAFWNLEAQNAFPEAKAYVLTRTHSDHHPISFTSMAGSAPNRNERPFRFEAAWLTHNDYKDVWKVAWAEKMGDVIGAINEVITQSKKWNVEVFGNIFKRKNLLQNRIQGIQASPWYNTARGLQVLERKLIKELSVTLAQEELLWFQKSRRAWIEDGDKNTNFYHKDNQVERNNPDRHHGYSLNPTEADCLTRTADTQEVRKAVFGMKRMGNPGPDGIQAAFYQDFWDIVSNPITDLVNQALTTGRVPVGILESFVTLIPKKDNTESAADFRPITLLNVVFKIITKVVVNRLRPLMDKLVGPHQNSFLPGRSTLDNIVLTQEIMHSMRNKKGKKGSLVMKVDLHKAYDSIDWGFLEHTLQDFGFPRQLISLVLFSLKESTIGILWNGGKLPNYTPGRGLRQGNPLASYLFILAMEKLSMNIHVETRDKNWKPVTLNRGGTCVSHIFFADDLMLFGEATEAQTKVIIDCLGKFSRRSGLHVNLGKSLIYCSPNTPNRTKRLVRSLSNIPVTLGKYLGIPILQKRVSRRHFSYILDNMRKKLANWKTGFLSLAGRRILVQSALATIPVYTMQTMALPTGTCNDIDKICRDFLWGSTDTTRKIHAVNWNEVCSPRDLGGLGLRMAKDFNLALLVKLAWQTMNNPEKLSVIEAGARWRVGNGESLHFLSDWWINDKPLGLDDNLNIPDTFANALVSDFIKSDRSWDVTALREALPEDIINKIRTIPIPIDGNTTDRLVLSDRTSGTFTVSSAYNSLVGTPNDEENWAWIWKLKVVEKVKTFVWLLLKDKLLTNLERMKRHMTTDSSCASCGFGEESTSHLLRDCPLAEECWDLAKDGGGTGLVRYSPISTWIKENSQSNKVLQDGTVWSSTFVYILWLLWKARNNLIFNQKRDTVVQIVGTARSMALEARCYIVNNKGSVHGQHKWVSWSNPQPGWVKLNTDGAMKSNTGMASADELIRDDHGRWVKGFVTKVGLTDSFSAELWGLREGLQLCLEEGLDRVWVELDSAAVVAILNGGFKQRDALDTLISDCLHLLDRIPNHRVSHIEREGNKCADWLANLGQEVDWGTTILEDAPTELTTLLHYDACNTPHLWIR
ncbi:PREDICTED: uncharacterized protein LOC109176414 [Ipomoea nil]|uniref:uncharacterized protein LOC109176414 n=1 Tax=Ipomoea nil TaxID=35883 RepID=UPI0009009200|nr:PREDICTED: uncharacterized protein LOC109176414 [Ipomoea nil]